jgi:xanthine dehydrogenase accessory factor
VVNPCLSGGALEIFLEPILPPPLIGVLGDTPIADAVVAIGAVLGWSTTRSMPDAGAEAVAALVVATHGRDENAAVRAALDAGVGYVAVVASRRRGTALLAELALTEDEAARVHTPAGLDIGARTAPEVAVSILAEVIAAVRMRSLTAPEHTGPEHFGPDHDAPREVLDPVCGMTVTVVSGTPQLVVDGEPVWFCGTGCRDHHALLVAQE